MLRKFCSSLVLMVSLGFAPGGHALDIKLSLVDLNGKVQSLSDYRGKWVVVNYWATWCPPCLEEIPDLVQFHDEHHETKAVVLGVNYEDVSRKKLEAFVDDYLISYPVMPSDPNRKTAFGNLRGLPTTVLVAPDGQPVARQDGPITAEVIEAFIQRYESRKGK